MKLEGQKARIILTTCYAMKRQDLHQSPGWLSVQGDLPIREGAKFQAQISNIEVHQPSAPTPK